MRWQRRRRHHACSIPPVEYRSYWAQRGCRRHWHRLPFGVYSLLCVCVCASSVLCVGSFGAMSVCVFFRVNMCRLEYSWGPSYPFVSTQYPSPRRSRCCCSWFSTQSCMNTMPRTTPKNDTVEDGDDTEMGKWKALKYTTVYRSKYISRFIWSPVKWWEITCSKRSRTDLRFIYLTSKTPPSHHKYPIISQTRSCKNKLFNSLIFTNFCTSPFALLHGACVLHEIHVRTKCVCVWCCLCSDGAMRVVGRLRKFSACCCCWKWDVYVRSVFKLCHLWRRGRSRRRVCLTPYTERASQSALNVYVLCVCVFRSHTVTHFHRFMCALMCWRWEIASILLMRLRV